MDANLRLCAVLWKMLLREKYLTNLVFIEEDRLDAVLEVWGKEHRAQEGTVQNMQ